MTPSRSDGITHRLEQAVAVETLEPGQDDSLSPGPLYRGPA